MSFLFNWLAYFVSILKLTLIYNTIFPSINSIPMFLIFIIISLINIPLSWFPNSFPFKMTFMEISFIRRTINPFIFSYNKTKITLPIKKSFMIKSFILIAISKFLDSISIFFIFNKGSLINIALKSDINTISIHVVIFPLTKIHISVIKIHDSMSIFKIVSE